MGNAGPHSTLKCFIRPGPCLSAVFPSPWSTEPDCGADFGKALASDAPACPGAFCQLRSVGHLASFPIADGAGAIHSISYAGRSCRWRHCKHVSCLREEQMHTAPIQPCRICCLTCPSGHSSRQTPDDARHVISGGVKSCLTHAPQDDHKISWCPIGVKRPDLIGNGERANHQ